MTNEKTKDKEYDSTVVLSGDDNWISIGELSKILIDKAKKKKESK